MKSRVLKMLMAVWAFHTIVLPINNSIAILLGYVMLVLTVLLPFDMLTYAKNRVNHRQLIVVESIFIIIAISVIRGISKLSFAELEEFFKSAISFLSFLLTLCVYKTAYSKKDLDYYFSLNRFLSFIFVIYTILPFPFRYTVANVYGNLQFTLSMGNPNATAIKIMFCIAMLLIQYRFLLKRFDKIFNILLVIGLLYTLLMLESRTVFICILIAIYVCLFTKIQAKSWKVNVMWLAPVLFIPLQILFERLPSLSLLNKSLLTGRQDMYADFINVISDGAFDFILGDFIKYRLENYHNIIFSLIFNVGIVGLVLYFYFWFIETRRLKEAQSEIANISWILFSLFIIHSSAESAAMSGAFGYGILVIVLNRLTKDEMLDINEMKKTLL